ncbi:hypothetical protein LOTGIDRAFT_163440 [Lottia gigantea]|uniref:ShKT domain-containing protein n=1 Tax=Lottia gigantea TaxID=225164 RepID=V3ZK76_LOTGI|nr:hypothetical protein LOTGIDRAFT_163440 [Lottia gigantea]ESO91708.1 hypothetical protein LOTGIDRAFT_163440 [Lottia gigantea]
MDLYGVVWLLAILQEVTSCFLTEKLPSLEGKEWFTKIRSGGSNDVIAYFDRNSVTFNDVKNTTNGETKWRCFMKIRGRYFLKNVRQGGGYLYKCMGIIVRSESAIQLEWSHVSRLADPALCAEENINLDPWLLISYKTVVNDFTSCPVSGGFDIKHAGYYSRDVRDSRGYDIGCNLMNIPMRLEFDCIAGEGAIFNFRSKNCVPDIHFNIYQNTICVAKWSNKRHHFVLLRTKTGLEFWCARFPVGIENQNETELYLYSDVACLEGEYAEEFVKFMKFDLQRVMYTTICADEYPQCKEGTCNVFSKLECQKTCGLCNPHRPPGICTFPKRMQGTYLLHSKHGNQNVTLEGRTLNIENVGQFDCIVFEDSPLRSTKTYTTMSIFQNGCRPRYTCVRLKRLGPSALRYSLAQNLVWPIKKERIGANICNEDNFRADGDPIRDTFRSYKKTGKPVIKIHPKPRFINCGMNTSYTIRAELPDGSICHGGFYQHCKNETKLRFDFHTCNSFIKPKEDFNCAGIFRTNYWERAVLIQNVDNLNDIRCLIFNSLRPYQALIVVADECDKMASGLVDSNIRIPIMRLHIRSDVYPCKHIQLPLKDDVITNVVTTTEPIKMNVTLKESKNVNSFSVDLELSSRNSSGSRPFENKLNSLLLLFLCYVVFVKNL